MLATASLVCVCLFPCDVSVKTRFEQTQPAASTALAIERSQGQTRAVVLIHGFQAGSRAVQAAEATFQTWQTPGSPLVRRLARDADVFAFAYGQNAALDELAELAALAQSVKRLRRC